jgi:hypothetical protein
LKEQTELYLQALAQAKTIIAEKNDKKLPGMPVLSPKRPNKKS